MIELLMVLTILGILANLVVSGLRVTKCRAEAAHVIADIHAIEIAAHSHHAERGVFPPSEQWGTVPATMTPMLPAGFEFRYGATLYRWHRYALPGGLPMHPGQTTLLAVEVQAENAELASLMRSLCKGRLSFGSATNLFFVLE